MSALYGITMLLWINRNTLRLKVILYMAWLKSHTQTEPNIYYPTNDCAQLPASNIYLYNFIKPSEGWLFDCKWQQDIYLSSRSLKRDWKEICIVI